MVKRPRKKINTKTSSNNQKDHLLESFFIYLFLFKKHSTRLVTVNIMKKSACHRILWPLQYRKGNDEMQGRKRAFCQTQQRGSLHRCSIWFFIWACKTFQVQSKEKEQKAVIQSRPALTVKQKKGRLVVFWRL